MLLIAIVISLLCDTMVCLQKIITSHYINGIVYHIKLVLDEKVQPGPYIRHTVL